MQRRGAAAGFAEEEDARSRYLPAKPASALDETLPLVQALVGVALELHREGGGGAAAGSLSSRVIPGSVEAELERKRENARLVSLYKLFPAMLDVVAVDGFRPDRIVDCAQLVELSIDRLTHDMDRAVELLTEPMPAQPAAAAAAAAAASSAASSAAAAADSAASGFVSAVGSSGQPCNPLGFHTECWQFLTILSRLLLFDSVDVIAPAATSHLPTALILFIGKLQARLAEQRQHSSGDQSASPAAPPASRSPPAVTALDIPSIVLHPYTTAATSFEHLHSQVFGMLYIMCRHESALYDVLFGGHLRALFSVFTNSRLSEQAFHDEQPDATSPAVWQPSSAAASGAPVHFMSSASFRAGVMMVCHGVMKEHPQDGLDYVQVHDIVGQLLETIASPFPPPRPAADQQPDPALEMVVDCVRLLMLVLRTAVRLAPTSTFYPPQSAHRGSESAPSTPSHAQQQQQQQQPSASSLPQPPSAAFPPAVSAAPSASSFSRPLHTSSSSNSVSTSLSVPAELLSPLPQSSCPLLEEFELSSGYDVLRDFVLRVLDGYEVRVDPAEREEEMRREEEDRRARERRRSRGASVSGEGGARRRKSFVHRRASKQSMVDDLLQQMRELAFIGCRQLRPTADQYLASQQPASFMRQTVRANFNPAHNIRRSRSQLGLSRQTPAAAAGEDDGGSGGGGRGGRRSERLELSNSYDVSEMYDALQLIDCLHTAHLPSLSVPAPHAAVLSSSAASSAQHGHGPHAPARPFAIHSSCSHVQYICNFSAFSLLFALSRRSASSYIRLMSLLHLHSIIAAHPYNFLTLREQLGVNLFNYLLHLLADAAVSPHEQEAAVHSLSFLLSFEYYVPYAEQLALVQSFRPTVESSGAGTSGSAGRAEQETEGGVREASGEDDADGSLATRSFSSRSVQALPRVNRSASVLVGRVLVALMRTDRVYHQNTLRDVGLLRLCLDSIAAYEPMLDVQERGQSKKMTSDQADEQQRNAAATRLSAAEQAALHSAMDVLQALLRHHFEHQSIFRSMDGGRYQLLLTRLLMSDVTRRRAISCMEALVELELLNVRMGAAALRPDSRDEMREAGLSSAAPSPSPSPPASRLHSRQQSAEARGGGGVHAYLSLLLDLLHELPVWHYEGKSLFLRSLRWLCLSSRRAQDLFRQRSGFFNLFLLLEKQRVPELQRRKALRRRQDNTSKTAAEISRLRGGGDQGEEQRARDEQRVEALLLFVRSVLLTLVAAMAGNAASRLQLSRFGFERLLDALYQTEAFAHPRGVECVCLWLLWLCVEYRQGSADGSDERFDSAAPLHPPHATAAEQLMLPMPAQTHVSLFACASVSLLLRTPVESQLRVLSYLFVLARDDVGNRAALGRVGLLSALLEQYRPLMLAPPDSLDERKRELRATLLLFVRVLASFSSGALDVNGLLSALEEPHWEPLIDSLIDMTAHANQNGRLWPFVLFDLSRRAVSGAAAAADRRPAAAAACISISSLRTASGQWPPRDGYTFSCWLHIDQFSVEDEHRLLLPSPVSSALESQQQQQQQQQQTTAASVSASASPSSSSVITLLCLESDDGRSYLRLCIRHRQLLLRSSRSAPPLHFQLFTFEPRSWYHIAVTHTAGGLVAASKASLFVNGSLVQSMRAASYLEPPAAPSAAIRGFIGQPADAASRPRALSPGSRLAVSLIREARDADDGEAEAMREEEDGSDSGEDDEEQAEAAQLLSPASSSLQLTALRLKSPRRPQSFTLSSMSTIINATNVGGLQWRIAQCQLTEAPVPDDRVATLYFSSPKDAGSAAELSLSASRRPAQDSSARYVVQAYDCYHSESRLRAYLAQQQAAQAKGAAVAEASSGSGSSGPAVVSAPPRPRAQPSSAVPLDKLLFFYHASSHLLSSDRHRLLLLNAGQDPLHPLTSHGELRGDCHLYRPRGLPDSIHKVGGLRRVLVLLARCQSSEAVVKVLTFLALLCSDSARNHQELQEDMNGYRIIAFILKHRVQLLTTRTVDCLAALTGLSDEGASGHIANAEAAEALLLDFSLWRDAAFSVRKRVFSTLLNAVSSNARKESNIAALRSVRLVQHIVSLLADQHEVGFRLCLTPLCLRLLSCVLREELREHELRLVAELVFCPSLSDEHNPQPQSVDSSAVPLDARQRSPSMEGETLLPDLSDQFMKTAVLEMLLGTLLRIQQHYTAIAAAAQAHGNRAQQQEADRERREKSRVFSAVMDLDWAFGVLKNCSLSPHAFTSAQEQRDIDAITSPRLYTETAVLTLRLLSVLLTSEPAMRERFTSQHAQLLLTHCLCSGRHCLSEALYEVLLAMMLGKQILTAVGAAAAGGGEGEAEAADRRPEYEVERFRREPVETGAVADGGEDGDGGGGVGGLSVSTETGASPEPAVLSPSKLTAEESPWDHLMFSTDRDGKEVCDAFLFMPEAIPIVFSLLQRALEIGASPASGQSDAASASGAQCALDSAAANSLTASVLVFFFKLFQRSSDFRLLFTMTNTAFLTQLVATVFAKLSADERRRQAERLPSGASSPVGSPHDISLLQRSGAPSRGSGSSSSSTQAAAESDDEDATFLSSFRASSAAVPRGVFASGGLGVGGDSDSDDDETGAALRFAPSQAMFEAISDLRQRETDAGERRKNSAYRELEDDAEAEQPNLLTLAERPDFDPSSPHGPLLSASAPPPPSDDSAPGFPLTTVEFSDKSSALLFRFLCQIVFHVMQNDRPRPPAQPQQQQQSAAAAGGSHNLAMIGFLFLSPASTVDAGTGLALPSAGAAAPPSLTASTEGWTLVDDLLDLVPPESPSGLRIEFHTRLLRYLASRVQSRVAVWSGELMSNGRLLNNFSRLCALWLQRAGQGLFQHGGFAVSQVCLSMLDSPTFAGAGLKQGLFASSANKTKARVVSQLLQNLSRALLLCYSEASRRQALTELLWCNAIVLAHPKHLIDPPAEAAAAEPYWLACLLFACFEQILCVEQWLQRKRRSIAGYEPQSEEEATELAVRARGGAMQIIAALLRCGKAEQIWRLLLQSDAESRSSSSLFLSRHSAPVRQLFGVGFECCLQDAGGEMLDWVMSCEQDIRLCLNATLVPRWTELHKLWQQERKAQFVVIDARLRAFARLRSMEAAERLRLLAATEQRTVRAMKICYDGCVALVQRRHDSEEQERAMQEQWEAMLRELRRLEQSLKEKEEKAHESRKQASQAVAKSEGAAVDGKAGRQQSSSAAMAEEELQSEIERKRRREQQVRWQLEQAAFWERNELSRKHSRRRNAEAADDDEEAAGRGGAGGGGGGGFGRRGRAGGRPQLAGSLAPGPSAGVDLSAFSSVSPAVLSSLLSNPGLSALMQSMMSNASLLQQMTAGSAAGQQLLQRDPAVVSKLISSGNQQQLQNFVAALLSGSIGPAAAAGADAANGVGASGGGGGASGGAGGRSGAAAASARSDLLSALQRRKSSAAAGDAVVVGDAAPPPPPPPPAGLPSFAPLSLSSPLSPTSDDEAADGYGPSRLPQLSSLSSAPPDAPPLDVPTAPPMDGAVPDAPPMAPPLDGDVPAAPPLAPDMSAPFAPPLAPAAVFKKPAASVRMKKLHWEALDGEAALSSDSVWSQLNPGAADIDFGEFESKFSATAARPAVKSPSEASGGSRPKFVSLLDPRRQQSIEIGLSRFGMSNADIVQALLQVDTARLSTEHMKRLLQFMPSSDEAKALRAFRGDPAQLGVAERFHLSLLPVPALSARVEACVNMLTLEERCLWLDSQLAVVEAAMRGIKDSVHLQEVLTTVLAFGNYMNGSKQVSSFRLSTLTRLGNTKSADNKTSLLHYLVLHFNRSRPDVRNFLTDLAPTKEAHRVETAFLTAELAALRAALQQMRDALRAVQAAGPPQGDEAGSDRFVSVLSPFLEQAAARVGRVDERLKAALHRGEKLGRYFGETDIKWEELFSLFLQFRTQYEQAEADIDRETELERTRKKNRELQARLRLSRPGTQQQQHEGGG